MSTEKRSIHRTHVFRSTEGSKPQQLAEETVQLMRDIYDAGHYPEMEIVRPENKSEPKIGGEFALPDVFDDYLVKELVRVYKMDQIVFVKPGRLKESPDDPDFLDRVEQTGNVTHRKKLFLFSPERIELSCERIRHYTHSEPEEFQRYILLTNYQMHLDIFKKMFPKAKGSQSDDCQMPCLHHKLPGNSGITMINIGVGPANAKTITDQIAVLRPDAMIMIGHCGGLKNKQDVGDFLLADKFLRDDHILDSVLSPSIPLTPTLTINALMLDELRARCVNFRIGTVFTTNNRNWEFNVSYYKEQFEESRAYGIDMESSVISGQGYRYKIPNATLLMVSDKPLHGQPKMSGEAKKFYKESKKIHVEVAVAALESLRNVKLDDVGKISPGTQGKKGARCKPKKKK